ncbi:MAG: translesion error-prone DNA polymerase V autoproteolytic subunit [Bdellovibrionota bacterium]
MFSARSLVPFQVRDETQALRLPLFHSLVAAGFPSPADEYLDRHLSLDELLIKNKSSTFFVRVSGESMKNAGIFPGDLLVIDRSLKAQQGSIVLAIVDGEFTIKRLQYSAEKVFLLPENDEFKAIEILDSMTFEVWGVVAHAIRSFR